MELFAACLLVTWVAMRVPAALADVYEQRKAAKAGNWDHLTKLREQRGQRPVDPPRPGLGAWVKDVYHGACEDALDRRAKRREARPPFDPSRPTARRKAVDLLKRKIREQRAKRGDTRPMPDDELATTTPAERMPCPRCGQTMTRSATGWTHPGGGTCTPPAPTSATTDRPPAARQQPSQPDHTPTGGAMNQAEYDRIYNGPDAQPINLPPRAGGGEVGARPAPPLFASPGGAATAAVPVVADVHTNEALRQAADQIAEGAAELAEAAAMAERARAKMAAAAHGASEAVSATSFDSGATAAAHAASDAAGAVTDTTISQWCEKSEAAGAAAQQMKASLEKYRDSEDLVASERIDARVLEPSAS